MEPPAKRQRASAGQQQGRKRKAMTPEVEVRLAIQMAARERSIDSAFLAYDRAKDQGIKVTLDSFACIMFLCSGGDDWEQLLQNRNSKTDVNNTDAKESTSTIIGEGQIEVTPELMARGHSLLEDMQEAGIAPNEICFTALSRMEALAGNPDEALAIAKSVAAKELTPRLRCFTPALVAYAELGNGAKAFEVDAAITEAGLEAGESEFGRLLQAAAGGGVEYSMAESVLVRMSRELTTLQPTTIQHASEFFKSPPSKQATTGDGSSSKIWKVEPCNVSEDGACPQLGEGARLAAIDLTDAEYEEFKSGIAVLAERQERQPNEFKKFVSWLEEHGPFGAVIDAANVAFYGQNFESGGFSFAQIGAAADRVKETYPDVRALVLLHVNRTKGPAAQAPGAVALLDGLRSEHCFYSTPHGSNDDWYWMYAAVAAGPQGLLVSNDEMRDHLFHMLSPRFFGKWKQRHQLKYHFSGSPDSLQFFYPPPFTTCAQKVEFGDDVAWMLPCVDGTWTSAKLQIDTEQGKQYSTVS